MRKYQAQLLFLAFLSLPAVAASSKPKAIPYPNTNDSIVIPEDSPVRYSGFVTRDGSPVAIFPGRFLLTGTYYYGDNAFNDSGDEMPSAYRFDPSAYIIPDDDVDASLPHFVVRNGKHTIFIKNPTAFANSVISKTVLRNVRCRNCDVATGHIAVWVDQFSAGITCDAPDYEARFLSVYKAGSAAIVTDPNRAC